MSASISQSNVGVISMASNTGMGNIQAIFASMPAQCQAVHEDQRRNSVRPTRAKSGIWMGIKTHVPMQTECVLSHYGRNIKKTLQQ